jgi:uncharacterized membrane protein YphA (DoxX/SURF4 family)
MTTTATPPARAADPTLPWISLIARLAIASMYASTSIRYLVNGTQGVVGYTERALAHAWLPMPLVTAFAHCIPWLELVIWVWLLVGYRLREAWIFAALYTVTLGFGNMLALEHANDYLHVLLCLVGLHAAAHDRWSVDGWRRG